MNWDMIEDNWALAAEKVRERWGKLSDADFRAVSGRRGRLVQMLRDRYGIARNEAERQIADWQRSATQAWFAREEDRM